MKSKDSKEKVYTIKPNYSTIVSRFLWSILALLLIGLLMGGLAWKELILVYPSDIRDARGVIVWFFLNMSTPHAVLYLSVIIGSWCILSEGSARYQLWLLKQSWGGLLLGFLAAQGVSVVIIGIAIYSSSPNDFVPPQNSLHTPMQSQLFAFSLMSTVYICWFGYKMAWRSYRSLGAMTYQDRYHADVRAMESKTSGQLWDRSIEPVVKSFLGSDGSKPRYGFLWGIIIGPLVFIISWVLGISSGVDALLGVSTFTVVPAGVLLFCCMAKIFDYKSMSAGGPYLIKSRDENSDDTIDFADTGVVKFNRS